MKPIVMMSLEQIKTVALEAKKVNLYAKNQDCVMGGNVLGVSCGSKNTITLRLWDNEKSPDRKSIATVTFNIEDIICLEDCSYC